MTAFAFPSPQLPTPYVIGIRRWSEGESTPHGYTRGKHGEPEQVLIHAVAPGPSKESIEAGRDADEVEWTVYAPPGVHVSPRDLVVLDGTEFEVVGNTRDYTLGPWANPVAGVEIPLKRWRG